jgi:hypothetical protein
MGSRVAEVLAFHGEDVGDLATQLEPYQIAFSWRCRFSNLTF